jgi:hypothetical protein
MLPRASFAAVGELVDVLARKNAKKALQEYPGGYICHGDYDDPLAA